MSVAALIFGSIGNFLVMFLGSALIGILFALVTALVSATTSYCSAVHVPAYICMYSIFIEPVLSKTYVRECVCMLLSCFLHLSQMDCCS